ncbi:MAG: endonuclease III [Anaerolineales bacterium]|nr:endonuclease III [Anaerolineales bacterium]
MQEQPVERTKKVLAQRIRQKLYERYGEPRWRQPLPPLDELISTILSQNTNDGNRDRAFEALRQRFPTWEAVRDAPLEAVIEAIRPAGLAPQKAPRIQAVLRAITEQCGELNLDFLKSLEASEALRWLRQFKGVGPKTAAIVVLFSLNKPAFPVDTHIHRVTRRLGLIPTSTSAEQAHDQLAELFEPSDYAAVHLNIIQLGREICQSRKPKCPICPLQEECAYYRREDFQ